MAITFYYGSGSPFGWRVWLALEHKGLPYERITLSFGERENKKPDYLAINPRGKVPSIVDGDFKLYESDAIVEYLDEKYPDKTLFPKDVEGRALARRIIREVDNLYTATRRIAGQLWTKPEAEWDQKEIEGGREDTLREYGVFDGHLRGDFFVGSSPTAADYAVYPFIATGARLEKKKADLGLSSGRPEKLAAWAKRIEALPYFDKTFPPHWR